MEPLPVSRSRRELLLVSHSRMELLLVSHFHWDREWYRAFQAFRARLVDAIDRVLELLDADPGYRFVLDGQAIVVEDYLAIRPERRAALERGVRDGRLAVGPWYVQPDSLLPGGEAHVRNLLLGRTVAGEIGPVSRVAYVPDSFGHPAQFPQLFSQFGLRLFVYWRGNGSEIDDLGPEYRWQSADGSAIAARLLTGGYFDTACLPDAEAAVRELARRAASAPEGTRALVLMNGFDHMLPDAHTGEVASALAAATGLPVRRALLDDLLDVTATGEDGSGGGAPVRRTHRGELVGGRLANLLPGVWSSRLPLKLANRACETELLAWTEPWAALGRILGTPDERPALRLAWKQLLANQAHDSIGGCSVDAVHEAMHTRLAETRALAAETTQRTLERLAGLGPERRVPWSTAQDVVVFNPSPQPRTDVVRVPLDAYPPMRLPLGLPEVHPLALTGSEPPGFAIDGEPVRVAASEDLSRVAFLPGARPFDLEIVARDVPAFGCRRYRVEPAAPAPDAVDDGRAIENESVRVEVAGDGTLSVRFAAAGGSGADAGGSGPTDAGGAPAEYRGLFAIEDAGDRGDSYDFDPVEGDPGCTVVSVDVRRWRHASGLVGLRVVRRVRVPRDLDASRDRRSDETVDLDLALEARLAPGVPRLDVDVCLDNRARDHRLRLVFPTGRDVARFRAATTLDVATRSTAPADDRAWVHRAPPTFPHQGWVEANGLVVCAPGLPEAEVTPSGAIAVTLVRAVGWIARYDLRSRPMPAGPAMQVPGAQCAGPIAARVSLFAGGLATDAARAAASESALRGAIGGDAPLLEPGRALLACDPPEVVLSSLKPAESGDGVVVRLLNPGDRPLRATLRPGFPVRQVEPVRCDETPADDSAAAAIARDGDAITVLVAPHALCSLRLDAAR